MIGFAITALVVRLTTSCLVSGVSMLAFVLGIDLSAIYFYWYEGSLRFWNVTPLARMVPVSVSDQHGYTSCPLFAIAPLGVVALARGTSLWCRAVGLLGALMGLSAIKSHLHLLETIARRCEDADEIVRDLIIHYRLHSAADDDPDLM